MPEIIDDKKTFSLSEVLKSIETTLMKRYTSSFWVKAEMNKLNYYQHSGHCYPDLVEKSQGKIVAEMRGILWRSDYQRVNDSFINLLKEPLRDGIKILMNVRVEFKARYGLSLRILDIDPSYTLGDLEREKQETIVRLKKEGLFYKNKALNMPLLPKRIAVISVESSKGYADFRHVIDDNPWGYRFSYFLFPSLLQGDLAVETMIAQLKRIRKVIDYFDLVAIVRGGGGEVGLTCYNNYDLVKFVCEFPIPIVTGIGHSTNTTVVEMAAHTNAITPTKVGENLLQYFHNFNVPVEDARKKIMDYATTLLNARNESFETTVGLFKIVAKQAIHNQQKELDFLGGEIRKQTVSYLLQQRSVLESLGRDTLLFSNRATLSQKMELKHLGSRLGNQILTFMRQEKTAIQAIEKNIELVHPQRVLQRGYSITLKDGKAVVKNEDIKKGQTITTLLANGLLTSKVLESKNPEQ